MLTRSQLKEIFDKARELREEFSEGKYTRLMDECEKLMCEDYPLIGINLISMISDILFFNKDVTDKELFQVILICGIEFEEE